jgi:hypothetical protein
MCGSITRNIALITSWSPNLVLRGRLPDSHPSECNSVTIVSAVHAGSRDDRVWRLASLLCALPRTFPSEKAALTARYGTVRLQGRVTQCAMVCRAWTNSFTHGQALS